MKFAWLLWHDDSIEKIGVNFENYQWIWLILVNNEFGNCFWSRNSWDMNVEHDCNEFEVMEIIKNIKFEANYDYGDERENKQ